MFMFIDGRPVVLSFALVESLYYKAFMERFPESGVSITQWRGSYEYQAIYPDIQMLVETGVITRDAMAFIGQSIVQANEAIKRPACLYSRVPERFKELGYDASIRIATEETKGTVAICVDQEREEIPRVLTVGADQDPDSCGYLADYYGSLDPDTIEAGLEITKLSTAGDGTAPTYIIIPGGWDAGVGALNIAFSGAYTGNHVFDKSAATTDEWTCLDAPLSDAIRGAVGQQIMINIAGYPATRAVNNDDDLIAATIRDEMLPGGQWMEGPVAYETALSNTQPITIRWATPTDWELPFRLTIVRRKGSPYPENTVDEIIEKFMTNFNAAKGVGRDIYPQTYLTTHDLPWAASILAEWTDSWETAWWSDDIVSAYNLRYGASVQPARVVIQ